MRLGEFEFTKRGVSRIDWQNPYQLFVSLSWPRFFAVLAALELCIHLVFATLYWADPGCIANAAGFGDDLFFSVETLATVGYGVLAPATTFGHVVACFEIYVGLTQTAIITGMIFVRFARPKGRIVFADKVVVTMADGTPQLMIRIGNAGTASLTAAEASLHMIMMSRTIGRTLSREMIDLALVRSKMPIFPLIWMLRHPVDETSPLYGMSSEDLLLAGVRIIATCSAFDPALSRARPFDPELLSTGDNVRHPLSRRRRDRRPRACRCGFHAHASGRAGPVGDLTVLN